MEYHRHHQCCIADEGLALIQKHGHGGWHPSRVPPVNCLSSVESGLSIESGVYQGIVSRQDQEDNQPTNR